MSVVTAIRAKGRSKDRFVVEVEGRALCVASPDLLVRFSVHVGEPLSQEDALVEAASRLAAEDRAVRMLAARGRSKRGLERRLVEKGESPEHARAAVERLSSLGLVDDAVFARQFVRGRARTMGRRRLAWELGQQGVSSEDAQAALEEVLSEPSFDARESLDELVAKKLRQLARFDEQTRRRRLLGFLSRRGFGGDEIRDALARVENRDR